MEADSTQLFWEMPRDRDYQALFFAGAGEIIWPTAYDLNCAWACGWAFVSVCFTSSPAGLALLLRTRQGYERGPEPQPYAQRYGAAVVYDSENLPDFLTRFQNWGWQTIQAIAHLLGVGTYVYLVRTRPDAVDLAQALGTMASLTIN